MVSFAQLLVACSKLKVLVDKDLSIVNKLAH